MARKYTVPTKKYKVSTHVRGKLRSITVIAKNKPQAQKKAANKLGKAADVGYFSINRL